MLLRTLAFFSFIFLLGGCIPSPQERTKTLNTLIKPHPSLHVNVYNTKPYKLFTIADANLSLCSDKLFRIYIEGDGLSYVTREVVSSNPTPINPQTLKLFLEDDTPCKLYAARPCQYVWQKECIEDIWTSKRSSQEVITSYLELLSGLKKDLHVKSFWLIGYSGGGSVALLTAAMDKNVSYVTTIAGNIDTAFWTNYHDITPLYGSLNPADYTKELENVPQDHLIGADDTIIPKDIFDAYIKRFNSQKLIHSCIYENVSHHDGWERIWKNYLQQKDKVFEHDKTNY